MLDTLKIIVQLCGVFALWVGVGVANFYFMREYHLNMALGAIIAIIWLLMAPAFFVGFLWFQRWRNGKRYDRQTRERIAAFRAGRGLAPRPPKDPPIEDGVH